MKVIDLLIKSAKREKMPKTIKFNQKTWYINAAQSDYIHYLDDEKENRELFFRDYIFSDRHLLDNTSYLLNDEVEIIEEDKNIEEIKISKGDNCKRFIEYDDVTGHHKYMIRVLDEYFANKINGLTKEVNKLKRSEK